MSDHHFGSRPPGGVVDWECQCARCGSSTWWVRCTECDGDGGWSDDEGEWYCDTCDGFSGWYSCLSSPAYCQANPLPGREDVQRGTIEWFPDTLNFVERHL